jgi:hypothetical protein
MMEHVTYIKEMRNAHKILLENIREEMTWEIQA